MRERRPADGGSGGTAGRGGSSGSGGAGATAGRGGAAGGGRAPQAQRAAAAAAAARGAAGTGSGGSGPTACTLQNHSGNGSFTWYNFAQGTARDGNGYRTACGYYGTANGTVDTVENIASMSPAANTYFAAIPGNNGFDSKSHCGECVEITGQNGTKIIATIIDECPFGSDGGNTACQANPGGHLDLSKTRVRSSRLPGRKSEQHQLALRPLPGQRQREGPLQVGQQQRVLRRERHHADRVGDGQRHGRPAPVRTAPGTSIRRSARPRTLNLTDMAGRSITVTMNSGTSNQDTGIQFPACQ